MYMYACLSLYIYIYMFMYICVFTRKVDMGEGFETSMSKPHILKRQVPEQPTSAAKGSCEPARQRRAVTVCNCDVM